MINSSTTFEDPKAIRYRVMSSDISHRIPLTGEGRSLGGKISGGRGHPPANILMLLERQLNALQRCRCQFLYKMKLCNRLFVLAPATVCKTVSSMLSVRCLSCPVCLSVTFVHCGQTVGRIKTKFGIQVCFGPGHFVLDGPSPSPNFKVEVRISKLDRVFGSLPVAANCVALEQQIILVKTRRESV